MGDLTLVLQTKKRGNGGDVPGVLAFDKSRRNQKTKQFRFKSILLYYMEQQKGTHDELQRKKLWPKRGG